jgi:hypothetical protein
LQILTLWSFTLNFTQKSQDFKFVAQMLVATNVIPFESIQSQTLRKTIHVVRENGKTFLSLNSLTFIRRDGWWWEKKVFKSMIGWRLLTSLMKLGL